MEKIDIIAEQTEFLLKKQKEVLNCFKDGFESLKKFLQTEQEKAEKAKAGPELASFQNVFALIDSQQKGSVEQLQEDVKFLEEQMAAIKQVQKLDDKEKADQIVEMMLEGGHELADTKKFKADVEQDAKEATDSFNLMKDDIQAVLEEDGIKELEMLLEAHAEERKQEEKAAKEESSCESSCKSCKGC